jgi:hypothetical protein
LKIEEYIGIFFLILITFALVGWVADRTVPPIADALSKLAVTCSCNSTPCNVTLNSTTVKYNYTNTLNYTYNNTYVVYANASSNCTTQNVTCPVCNQTNIHIEGCSSYLARKYDMGSLFSASECCQFHSPGFWVECCNCID